MVREAPEKSKLSFSDLLTRSEVFKNIRRFMSGKIGSGSKFLRNDALVYFYWYMSNNAVDEFPSHYGLDTVTDIAEEMLTQGLLKPATVKRIRRAVGRMQKNRKAAQ